MNIIEFRWKNFWNSRYQEPSVGIEVDHSLPAQRVIQLLATSVDVGL